MNTKKVLPFSCLTLLFALLSGCGSDESKIIYPTFINPEPITITGYSGIVMEPFISRDGQYLFFNNSNDPSVDTNLHWAAAVTGTSFNYEGEIINANSTDLDGVASMSLDNVFYFVSTRSYDATLSTLYKCDFNEGSVTGVELVPGISKLEAGWLNFDAEVSAGGNFLYTVDGLFNESGQLLEADLVVAGKSGESFNRLTDSDELLANINTTALEYAPCTSLDGLELYFTRVEAPITVSSSPKIYVAVRNNVNEKFSKPKRIESIEGFVEAPTLFADGSYLYYHKKDGDTFVLQRVERK